jgi:uracil-DNA glycosylase
VVFVQSRGEKDLGLEKAELLAACWPFHQAVIDNLNVRTILCFGGTAGTWVREQLGANELIDRFTETNKRGWTSRTHRDGHGRQVVTVTHPSRVDWRNVDADPTPLVERALARG